MKKFGKLIGIVAIAAMLLVAVVACNNDPCAKGHSWQESSVIPATCTTDGSRTLVCSVCGAERIETIPSAGAHTYSALVAKQDATCTTSGMEAHYTCTECNALFVLDGNNYVQKTRAQLIIDAKGHSYGDLIAEQPATCTLDGVAAHYHCDACDKDFVRDGDNYVEKTEQELVIPAGHVYGSLIAEVPADRCKADGVMAHYECSACNKLFVKEGDVYVEKTAAQLVIAKSTDHTPIADDHDCTTALTCSYCGDVITPAESGHDYDETTHVCKHDGCTKEDPSFCEHASVTFVPGQPANCTDNGSKEHYTCDNCTAVFEKVGDDYVEVTIESLVITALGHSYGEPIAEQPATCTADGVAAHYHCDACGKDFVLDGDDYVEKTAEELVIEALGHDYGALNPEVPSTCVVDGTKEHKTCSVCGKHFDKNGVEIEDLTIPADPDKHNIVANECTNDGCDVVYTAQQVIDMAYALAKGKALPGTYRLTGYVKTIDTPYSEEYDNVSVIITVIGADKTILCFRLKGEGADAIKVGDKITVTGAIKNYNNTVEFDAGCTFVSEVKTDEEYVALVKENLTVQGIAEDDFVLPTTVDDVTISWESDNEAIAIDGANAIVTKGASNAHVTLTATFTKGTASDTKTYEVIVPQEGGAVVGTPVTFDFKNIDFSSWTNSYKERVIEYPADGATVTFEAASKQTGTITNMPVSKGQPVVVDMGGKKILSVAVVLKQWTTKAQTVTLNYGTDGTEWTATSITSDTFTIAETNISVYNATYIKLTFSSQDNQVGIESITITYFEAPACSHNGEITYTWNGDHTECVAKQTCTICGEVMATETASGSSIQSYVTQDKSCEDDELTEYVANFDNALFVTQTESGVKTGDATGHDYKPESAIPATCETEGFSAYYECSVCRQLAVKDGEVFIKKELEELAIAALGHEYGTLIAEIPATCTDDGVSEHFECSACHKLFVFDSDEYVETTAEELVIAALGHDYDETTHVCKHDGCDEFDPSVCAHDDIFEVPAKAATCTETGNVQYYYCSACNMFFEDEEGENEIEDKDSVVTPKDPTNHSSDEYTYISNDDGTHAVFYACCEEVKTESEPCSGGTANCTQKAVCEHCEVEYGDFYHDFGIWVDEVPATCTALGTKGYKTCSICEKNFDENGVEIDDLTIAMIPHVQGIHHEETTGSCSPAPGTNGTKEYWECSGCGANIDADCQVIENISVPFEHDYVHHPATASTCTVKGNVEYYTCSKCHGYWTVNVEGEKEPFGGDPLELELALDENNHDIVANACTNGCGLTYTEAQVVDMLYALDENGNLNGTYQLTGTIKTIDYAYNSSNNNVTVTIEVVGIDKTVKCFKMTGGNGLKVGDKIVVTGNLKDYNGTKEFDQGCTYVLAPKTDAELVADAKANLTIASTATEDFELTTTLDGVTISWESDNSAIAIDGANATVTRGASETSVTLTATFTKGEATDTKTFTVTVPAEGAAEPINVTYTFTSKDWADETNSWTNNKSASQMDSAKGVAVQKAQTGAGATTKDSFTNVSKVIVVWGTSSNGVGSFAVEVNGVQVGETTVSKSQTDASAVYEIATPISGQVSFTVTCTTSTIYIKSIQIFYEA